MIELEYEQLELFAEVTFTDPDTGENKDVMGWVGDPAGDTDVLDALDVPEGTYDYRIIFTDIISPFKIPSWAKDSVYDIVGELHAYGSNLNELINDYLDRSKNGDSRLLTEDELYDHVIASASPEEAFRLGRFADINHSDTYFKYNGNGNIEGLSDHEALLHSYDLVAEALNEI